MTTASTGGRFGLRPPGAASDQMRCERGSVSLVVAISLVALFGATALSIDAGGAWTLRRALVTATDASALAAARRIAASGPEVCAEAAALGISSAAGEDASTTYADNRPGDVLDALEVQADCALGTGRVTVRGSDVMPAPFARVLGVPDVLVRSGSGAQWGVLSSITGLRPIGVCVDDVHVSEWLTMYGTPAYAALRTAPGHPVYGGAGVVHRVYFEKTSPAACGARVPGNWAWLDFDGARPPSGATALRDRLLRGYDGSVTLGAIGAGDEDCDDISAGREDCPGETGANASTQGALDELVCRTETDRCPAFPIVVYDSASGTGSGAAFHPVLFVGVVLRGYAKIGGSPKPDSYFDFEFVRLDWTGGIGAGFQVPAVHGVQLCRVDDSVHCDV